MNRFFVVLGSAIAIVVLLGLCWYILLWLPSLSGWCNGPEQPYRISTLHGRVVGKSLGLIQYRWLRRRFTPVGTVLRLETAHYEIRPDAGLIQSGGRFIGSQVIGDDGTFDFGSLPPLTGDSGYKLIPDAYGLSVKMPGEDAFGFRFYVDPKVHNSDVLIDASPAYYCKCCGWDFEPR